MLKDSDDNEFNPHISRDHLAGDRTVLANERTLLAYIRTALTFFVAGVSFIKFFDHAVLAAIGWIFIPVAVVILWMGLRSFRHNNHHIYRVLGDQEEKNPKP